MRVLRGVMHVCGCVLRCERASVRWLMNEWMGGGGGGAGKWCVCGEGASQMSTRFFVILQARFGIMRCIVVSRD